jgi:phage-related protein
VSTARWLGRQDPLAIKANLHTIEYITTSKIPLDKTSYILYTSIGDRMLANIYYFVDERGDKPVEEFIRSLPAKERVKIFAYIMELKNQGHNLRRPIADYIGNGIYELRPKSNRVFYFFFLKDSAVLMHAIRKKRDKVPGGDLKLCIKRKEQVEELCRVEKLEL